MKIMEKYYKNKRTGETTKDKDQAVEWYMAKDEVEIWDWSEIRDEWIFHMEWTW